MKLSELRNFYKKELFTLYLHFAAKMIRVRRLCLPPLIF